MKDNRATSRLFLEACSDNIAALNILECKHLLSVWFYQEDTFLQTKFLRSKAHAISIQRHPLPAAHTGSVRPENTRERLFPQMLLPPGARSRSLCQPRRWGQVTALATFTPGAGGRGAA